MPSATLERTRRLVWRLLRHPLALVSLPLAMLAISRLGGEPALMAASLAATILLAVLHLGRRRRSEKRLSLCSPEMFGTYLVNALADPGRVRSACLMIALDRAEPAGRAKRRVEAERLIRVLARRAEPVLRSDDVIARLDGATLGIALSPGARLSIETVIQTALRLQRRLGLPVDPGAHRAGIPLRIGVALAEPGESAGGLMERARDALQKAAPGTILCAEPATPGPVASDAALAMDLARDLSEALAEGQIGAFFQPQVSTVTGALTGVEALARWDHPQHGVLHPGQFLRTVEAADLMGALTETMVSNALRALAEWDRIGLAVPRVSVNFAAGDLSDPTLAERVAWMLDAFDIAPARLGIEVLESVLNLKGDEGVSQVLWRLRDLGCYIDLDDFGTGSTSITNIRHFAVERLKIDRSFVIGIDTDEERRAMVRAILTMARQLRIDSLAEGVETPEEGAVLAELGCGHVQGYAIGRPMPLEGLATWVAQTGAGNPAPGAVTGPQPSVDDPAAAARAAAVHKPPSGPREGQGKTA